MSDPTNPPTPLPSPWSQRILDRLDPQIVREACTRLQERRKDNPDVVQFVEMADSRGKSVAVVPDRLLIRTTDLDEVGREIVDRLGLTTERVHGLDGQITRLKLPADRTDQLMGIYHLLREEGVPVEPNVVVPTGGGPNPPPPPPDVVWKSLSTPEPVFLPSRPAPGVGTQPPHIVVLDTGITDEDRADGWLQGLVHPNRDNVDPLDVFPAKGLLDLAAGHGSFIAGIIQQIAPAARLDVRKVVDSDGLADETKVARAMVEAARDGADILNLSLGTQTVDDRLPLALAGAMEIIRQIEQAENREILVVAAAGNSPKARKVYPAALKGVIAVAALTPTFEPTLWSTRGWWVDCSAVGEHVVSTYVQGTEDPFVRHGYSTPFEPPDEYGPNSWAIWDGTSFATPVVVGRIARLVQQHGLSVRAALARLLSGRHIPGFGAVVK